MSKKVLAIVPVYNAPSNIVNLTINSLLSQNYEGLRIVVIDDCSEESKYLKLKDTLSKVPNVTLIRNEINLGFADTLNRAIQLLEDETFLFVLEHDCELLTTNYVSQAVKHFDSKMVAAVCGESVLPPSEQLPSIKRVFVNHLSEDLVDSKQNEVGFLMLKADMFRVSALKSIDGFESAANWKFASEEHIISFKIRSLGCSIVKDPTLLFRNHFALQESLLQNLRKEAAYGRGIGYAYASQISDFETGKSLVLRSKKISRIFELFYIFLSLLSLPIFLFDKTVAIALAIMAFSIFFMYLLQKSLKLISTKDKLLFIFIGYLCAWVYIPNFGLGILLSFFMRSHNRTANNHFDEVGTLS